MASSSSLIASLCDAFLAASRAGDEPAVQEALTQLRKEILFNGIHDPPSNAPQDDSRLTLRGKIWKALIGVNHVSAQEYLQLIEMGTSVRYDKIRGDSFRTFPDEKIFTERVPEPSIIRLLNSFTNAYASDSPFSYRQGMNAIAAPLLWCMPEVDAYFAFEKLITEKFPLYWTNDVVGGEAGCKLVDEVLALVDPELYSHLSENGTLNGPLTAYVYAFSCVSSLSSSVPPFEELILLWDFLLTFGVHLNILCVVAQVVMMRDKLLATTAPKALLDYRKWPQLRARVIISVVMFMLPRIPPKLYDRICKHATDPKVCSDIVGRSVQFNWKPKRR